MPKCLWLARGITGWPPKAAIERLGENVPGAQHSTLYLNECVDNSITDFAMLRDRAVREKVAAYVERLKALDREIFDCLIGPEG